MFTNHYDITVHNETGASVSVALRLPISAQLELKKKYNEDTRTTLFEAAKDDEKMIEILTKALNWSGNTNALKSGEDLIESLIDSGDFGIVARQRLMIELGGVSGIFSNKEKDMILGKVDKMEDDMLHEVESEETDEKN